MTSLFGLSGIILGAPLALRAPSHSRSPSSCPTSLSPSRARVLQGSQEPQRGGPCLVRPFSLPTSYVVFFLVKSVVKYVGNGGNSEETGGESQWLVPLDVRALVRRLCGVLVAAVVAEQAGELVGGLIGPSDWSRSLTPSRQSGC